MKECIKDFCDKETKEKCDSFYKEAFLNRNELVRMLKEENKQLKSLLKYKQELIEKIKENVTDSAFEVNTKEYGKLEVVETNVIFETSIRWNK